MKSALRQEDRLLSYADNQGDIEKAFYYHRLDDISFSSLEKISTSTESTRSEICVAEIGRLWHALNTPASILVLSYASLLLSFLMIIRGIVSTFS